MSRFDGETFKNYTRNDGLADNNVRSICQDAEGHIWFGTYGGGVSRFDGQVFQTIALKDGLIHNAVQHVDQAADGAMWIATEAGTSRYRRPTNTPTVHLRDVVADRRYGPRRDHRPSPPPNTWSPSSSRAPASPPPPTSSPTSTASRASTTTGTPPTSAASNTATSPPATTVRSPRRRPRPQLLRDRRRPFFAVVRDAQQDRIDALEAELSQPHGLEQFIGQSPALRQTFDQIHTVADTDVTVLILGETGTGKGLAARAIHALSPARTNP